MLEPGQRIERYVVESLIGEGGMARVYAVRHEILGSRHALKVLSSELLQRPGLRERFLAEGRILAQLKHPNLVAVTDVVVQPGIAGLVQELLVGMSLADRLEESGPMASTPIVEIVQPILDAIHHVHEAGIVHRDLKPSNIFLHRRDDGSIRPVVLDFGIARLTSATEVDHGRKRRTRTGATLGTAHYMSPEQLQAPQSVDRRTDIFSLGAVLYEMATGRVAFDGDTEFVVMQRIAQGAFDLDVLRKSPASGLQGVVAKALARDAGERYPDCVELGADLARAAGGAHVPTPRPRAQEEGVETPGTGGRGLQVAVIASVVVSVLLCIVIAALLAGRGAVLPAASGPATAETSPAVEPESEPLRRTTSPAPEPRGATTPTAPRRPTPTPRRSAPPQVRVEATTPAPIPRSTRRSLDDLASVVRQGSPLPGTSLGGRSCNDLWVLRNWVYARHGYAFTTSRARGFFETQAGYRRNSRVTSATVGRYLSPTDVSNRDRVVEAEQAGGCR
jgi:eukaryotic-like serine/threonine-protein kinase